LVLAASALPVTAGSEYLLAEEAVLLGLQRAVVDGLGLLDLAERPAANIVSGRQTDLKLVETRTLEQCFSLNKNCQSAAVQISSIDEVAKGGERLMPSSSAVR